jgi:hypothetical protein
MTTKKSHAATVMVKLGDSEWTPSCHADMERARAKSTKAGQRKAKGVPPADVLPIHVRPLTETEQESKPRCLISKLGV